MRLLIARVIYYFYRVFAAELSHMGNFMITPEDDVHKSLHQMHIARGKDLNIEQIRIVAA